MTRIHWFRRDLRLDNNAALAAASDGTERLVCVYIHAPEEEAPWQPGAASRWWLHRSLAALDAALRSHGNSLLILRGPSARALAELARRVDADQVHATTLVEPAARQRDKRVAQGLSGSGIELILKSPDLMRDPATFRSGAGTPYRVFTPFWKSLRADLIVTPSKPLLELRESDPRAGAGVALDSLGLAPRVEWDEGLRANWTPGADSAHAQLEEFLDDDIARYADERNRPDLPGTSRLSPHLHFGEITSQQIVSAVAARGSLERFEPFLREIGWRDFSHHLLWHFPQTSDAPMDPRFAAFPWHEPPNCEHLTAWQQGRTGVPMIDAGMRELWQTGWMHGRVRMLVASYLTKNLRIHWLHGARWFWDTLVDADLSNNSAGWQWTAGSGADAAPYFRIFNPALQGTRFDPRGDYVRRWVPELIKVPAKHLHSPWMMTTDALRTAALDNTVYARPLVDLADSRKAALAGYDAVRSLPRS